MEDEVKDKILKYLYDFNNKKGIWTTAGKVISELKTQELDKIRINNNINILIGEHYIDKKVERIKGLSGGTIPFEKIKISNKGIKLFVDSKYFQKPLSSITIQASEGSNVVFVSGNQYGTVNQSTGSSIEELDKLIEFIKAESISPEEKRSLIGDIETIKSQLIKPNPSKEIIKYAWFAISSAATLSGAHDYISKIGPLLKQWIGC